MADTIYGDREYDEVYRAFTYGLQLNRQGLDRKTWVERYWERFERRDLKRRVYILNNHKGSSVCGDRDTLMFTKRNDKRSLLNTDTIEENQQSFWREGQASRNFIHAYSKSRTSVRSTGSVDDAQYMRQNKPNFF